MIHFNSSSLYSNFSKIKDYLQQLLFKFSVLAVSETWLRDGKEMATELEGYELFK